MIISDLSVRRPVFATVMSLLLFILGLGRHHAPVACANSPTSIGRS